MSPGPEIVGDGPDENEPADNHQQVRYPLAAVDAGPAGRIAVRARGDGSGVKVVTVRVGRLGVPVPGAAAHTIVVGGRFHIETILDDGYAEARERAVLGRVCRM